MATMPDVSQYTDSLAGYGSAILHTAEKDCPELHARCICPRPRHFCGPAWEKTIAKRCRPWHYIQP
jgi:hypothetical protein